MIFVIARTLSKFALTAILLATAWPAQASPDVEILLDVLRKKGVITEQEYLEIKSREEQQAEVQEQKIAEAVKEHTPTWVDNMQWNGDLRLREDWQDFDRAADPGKPDRNRQRIRARFGFTYAINEKADFGMQLASGDSDPVSTNQSLDDRFSSKSIVLDLAYVKHLFLNDRVTFYGGKFKNPYHNTSYIAYDPDLHFEGIAAQIDSGNGAFLSLGAYSLDEISGETSDPWMWGAQTGYNFAIHEAKGSVSAAYYDFIDTGSIDEDDAPGNTEDEFDLLEISAKLDFMLPVYLGLQADYLYNLDADKDAQGWLVGAKFGHDKIKDFKDWQIFGTYSTLEANAQYDEFTDSDFHSGGTNNEGFTIGYNIGLGKGWEHAFKYYDTKEVDGPRHEEQRIQADLQYKF